MGDGAVRKQQFRAAPQQLAAVPRVAPSGLPFVTFVRGPIVGTFGAFNNEATPALSLACLAGYIGEQGYEYALVDAIAPGLNRWTPLEKYPGYQLQGLPPEEKATITRMAADIEKLSTDLETVAVSVTDMKSDLKVDRNEVQRLRESVKDHEKRMRAVETKLRIQ